MKSPLAAALMHVRHPFLRPRPRTREQITDYQNLHLRRLIASAYDRVPYYRSLFDRHGLEPGDIRIRTDLLAVPITDRDTIQSLPINETLAAGVETARLLAYSTSGSSGRPLTIRRTWNEERCLAGFRMRAMRDHGLRFTDMEVSVRHVQPTTTPWQRQRVLRVLQAMGLFRKVWVDCRLPVEDIIRELEHYRPDVLFGLPHVLSRVAATGAGEPLHVRPRFVAVGGDVLTPVMRRQICDAFQARVFNQYGSFECNLIAWECKVTGQLHTCDDSVIVEVLKNGKPAQPGESGEVVVTNLHAFAMPFIRYRLGDIVTQGVDRCPCGEPFSTISDIQGRMVDYFQLPGGRSMHPYEIGAVLNREAGSWLHHFQVTQERTDRIIMRAVASVAPSPQQLDQLAASISSVLGPGIEFRVVLVPELDAEPSGKFRVYRSLVRTSPRQGGVSPSIER